MMRETGKALVGKWEVQALREITSIADGDPIYSTAENIFGPSPSSGMMEW